MVASRIANSHGSTERERNAPTTASAAATRAACEGALFGRCLSVACEAATCNKYAPSRLMNHRLHKFAEGAHANEAALQREANIAKHSEHSKQSKQRQNK